MSLSSLRPVSGSSEGLFRSNKQRRSYGIICFVNKSTGIEILLVKKAVTYNFVQFVNGTYKPRNEYALTKLFSGMTFSEKLDILSCNFASLWRRIYPRDDLNNVSFRKKASIFEDEMKWHGIDYIKKLMSKATAIDTLWEIPKGRSDMDEKPIETAIREFNEETQNQIRNIEILWHQAPYIESYRDYGVTYINTYYFAEYKNETSNAAPLNIDFRKNEIGEIVSARWFSVEQLLRLDSAIFISSYTKTLLKNAKKIIKKHSRSKFSIINNIGLNKTS